MLRQAPNVIGEPRPHPPILQSWFEEEDGEGTWSLRVAGQNQACLEFPPGEPEAVRVVIGHADGRVVYDIQLNYPRLRFVAGRAYRFTFLIRADAPRLVSFGIAQSDKPWANLGTYRTIDASPEWREVEVEFASATEEENGRIHFDLGDRAVSVEVASLKVGTTD